MTAQSDWLDRYDARKVLIQKTIQIGVPLAGFALFLIRVVTN